jgi:hypothetical protein
MEGEKRAPQEKQAEKRAPSLAEVNKEIGYEAI